MRKRKRERAIAVLVSESKSICIYFHLILPGDFRVNHSDLSMNLTISKSKSAVVIEIWP